MTQTSAQRFVLYIQLRLLQERWKKWPQVYGGETKMGRVTLERTRFHGIGHISTNRYATSFKEHKCSTQCANFWPGNDSDFCTALCPLHPAAAFTGTLEEVAQICNPVHPCLGSHLASPTSVIGV